MKKYLSLILSLIAMYFFTSVFAVADHGTDKALTYKVTMKKVELCTGSTPDKSNMTNTATCTGAVTIGNGVKVVDIAAVGAGMAAATYGDATLLPLGETYTHMRVTIDRTFTIKGTARSDGGTTCSTRTAGTSANYPGGSHTGTEKYTYKPVVAASGTAQEMENTLVSDNYTRCNNAACSNQSADVTMTYNQGTGSATAQTQHADGSTNPDHVMTYLLTKPFTVSMVTPTIDISFGTKNSIVAHDVGTLCMVDNAEPVVTITIE